MESEAVRNETEEYQLIRRHMDMLNSHPLWRSATKIFIPENNLGLEASHLHGLVQEYPDVVTYWQNDQRPGVVMTHESKNRYHKMMTTCLYQGKLLFERDLFTTSRNLTVKRILPAVREQFERYHWEVRQARDNYGKRSLALTGKMGTKNDDMCVALQMIYDYGHQLTTNPRNPVFDTVNPANIRRIAMIEVLVNAS